MIEFSVQSVRECKGAALSVLCLLALSSLAVSQEWLERNSGYTDKPVSQALAYLRETGRIVKTSTGWMLAEGFQLPLPGSRNISDSVLVIDSESVKDSIDNVNNNNKSRNISDSIWAELAQASVKRNERTEALVQMEHVTVEYVRAKWLEFKRKQMGGYQWAGLFIKALEANEPVELEPERVANRFALPDDDESEELGVCYEIVSTRQGNHGIDVPVFCKAETLPGKSRCSLHGGCDD